MSFEFFEEALVNKRQINFNLRCSFITTALMRNWRYCKEKRENTGSVILLEQTEEWLPTSEEEERLHLLAFESR